MAQKDSHVQLVVSCIYSLVLCCHSEKSIPIPSGSLFLYLKNKNPLHVGYPVLACSEHNDGKAQTPVFDLISSNNTRLSKFQNKHLGFEWIIPEGNRDTEVKVLLKFTCCTADAPHLTNYSKWGFTVFYGGDIASHTIIPTFSGIKVSPKITSVSSKLTSPSKLDIKQEPQSPVVWDFSGEESETKSAKEKKLKDIRESFLKLESHIHDLGKELGVVIRNFDGLQ